MKLADYAKTHAAACERLLELRRRGNWGHAYLFLGDDTAFLEEFAMAWLQGFACASRLPDGDACGACTPCHAFAHGNYPDLHVLRPHSKMRTIKIDHVRELEHLLGLTSHVGMKLGLLVEADRLGEEAQNAFLKTLEEPPKNTFLVLLSTQPRHLLPTVRSRCQIIHLARNRKRYDLPIALGLFPVLARLRQGAGAAEAITASHRLGVILDRLAQEAKATAGELTTNPQMAEAILTDKTLKKQLEEELAIRVDSDYLRRRSEVLEAVHVWFMQLILLAKGVPGEALPHPEVLAAGGGEKVLQPWPTWSEADQALRLTEETLRYLGGNINEKLALEAWCLSLCERAIGARR